MSVVQILIETRVATLRRLLPATPELPAWHAALTGEIATHLTPAHAAILAEPVAIAGGWRWQATGKAMRRFSDLPVESRRALLAAGGSILSDIRRLAESGQAPMLAQAWPALRETPGHTCLFAVDGRPVLAAWGHAAGEGGENPFLPYDDGRAWQSEARPPWTVYGVALAAVALLALAAGLLLPAAARWAVPPPAACRVAPGQLDAMLKQNLAVSHGEDLKRLLAGVNDDIGRKQLLCPLPGAPPPRPPPPHAELPRDRWDRHDLSMLDGCWHNVTELSTVDERTHLVRKVSEWKLCFDRSGHGQQSISYPDIATCHGGGDRVVLQRQPSGPDRYRALFLVQPLPVPGHPGLHPDQRQRGILRADRHRGICPRHPAGRTLRAMTCAGLAGGGAVEQACCTGRPCGHKVRR